jgi:hypothetical protein|tara:strand:- start:42 stop:236 length:195 start_codon:yes stop_codon:yes gene_type:complete
MTDRERAIETCKNLMGTIKSLSGRKEYSHLLHDMFDKPQPKSSKLKYMLKKIIQEHNITKEELK